MARSDLNERQRFQVQADSRSLLRREFLWRRRIVLAAFDPCLKCELPRHQSLEQGCLAAVVRADNPGDARKGNRLGSQQLETFNCEVCDQAG